MTLVITFDSPPSRHEILDIQRQIPASSKIDIVFKYLLSMSQSLPLVTALSELYNIQSVAFTIPPEDYDNVRLLQVCKHLLLHDVNFLTMQNFQKFSAGIEQYKKLSLINSQISHYQVMVLLQMVPQISLESSIQPNADIPAQDLHKFTLQQQIQCENSVINLLKEKNIDFQNVFGKCRFTNLRQLKIKECQLTDEQLMDTLNITGSGYCLRHLNLQDNELTDRSLIFITRAFCNLQVLNLSGNNIVDATVLNGSPLSQLQKVDLSNNPLQTTEQDMHVPYPVVAQWKQCQSNAQTTKQTNESSTSDIQQQANVEWYTESPQNKNNLSVSGTSEQFSEIPPDVQLAPQHTGPTYQEILNNFLKENEPQGVPLGCKSNDTFNNVPGNTQNKQVCTCVPSSPTDESEEHHIEQPALGSPEQKDDYQDYEPSYSEISINNSSMISQKMKRHHDESAHIAVSNNVLQTNTQSQRLQNLSAADCERGVRAPSLMQCDTLQTVELLDSGAECVADQKQSNAQLPLDDDINSLIDSMNASIASVISPKVRQYSSQLLNPEKAMVRINQQAKIQKIKNPVLRIALMATSSLQEQLTSEHPSFVFSLNDNVQANYNKYGPERSYIFDGPAKNNSRALQPDVNDP